MIFFFLLVNTLRLIYSIQEMRPSKDDYCIGETSQLGILGSVYHYFNTWSGNVTSNFLVNLLVGLPLTSFDSWWIASAVPLVASTVFFCSTLTFLYSKYIRELGLLDKLFMSLFFCNLLVSFFWGTYNQSIIKQANPVVIHDLADSIAMWQTVTVTYFLTPTLIFILLIYFLSNNSKLSNASSWILTVTVGLIIGFADYNSVAVALMSIFLIGVTNIRNYKNTRRNYLFGFLLFSTISFAAAISFFSPGSTVRKKALDVSSIDFNFSLLTVFAKKSLSDLQSLIFQPTGLFVAGFGVILYLLFAPKKKFSLRIEFLGLLIVIVLHILLNNVSEVFSYHANWHRLPQFIFSFIVWLLLGFALGRKLQEKHVFNGWKNSRIVSTLIVVFVVLLCAQSLSNLDSSLKARNESWQSGARYHGIDEIKTEWINNCWIKLVEIREAKGLQNVRN